MQACDEHHLCVTCVCLVCRVCSLANKCMPTLHATVHVHSKFLSFTCGKCAGARMYPHTCAKLKLSCTIRKCDNEATFTKLGQILSAAHMASHCELVILTKTQIGGL